MSLRAACITALSLLALASCDDTSTTNPQAGDSPKDSTGQTTTGSAHPAALVGSWASAGGDYATAHMVLRGDGSGASVGVSGTRRDVKSIRWSADDTTFTISDSTNLGASKVYRIHGDSLLLLTRYIFADTTDTIVFVRESEPSLVPTTGEHASQLAGNWIGAMRTISGTMDGDNRWIPTDTSWIPDAYRFRADGTGENIEYGTDYVCDTIPLGRGDCYAGGFCDSLTTPRGCDPEYDGQCDYSDLVRCHDAYVPEGTTRFTWWTSKGHLYLGFWGFGTATPPRSFAGTQVVGWSVTGDSLKINAYFDDTLMGSYKRER